MHYSKISLVQVACHTVTDNVKTANFITDVTKLEIPIANSKSNQQLKILHRSLNADDGEYATS